MKVLVAISKVPDTTTKITLKDDKINEDGVQWIINPYDEWYALVKAIEIKEKDASVKVTVLSVGDNSVDVILRKALAYGADDAVRIDAFATDSFSVASQIAHYAEKEGYDLLLFGKESMDYAQGAVGGIVAGLMNLPYAALATSMDVNNRNEIKVQKEIASGTQTEEITLPAVVSCTKGMATQRIPNMRGIMAARTKPLTVVTAIESQSLTEVTGYELPEPKGDVKIFDKVEELVHTLKEKKLI